MNLTDIETFLTLVETRNITKTAESLFVTQPTVSRRLQNLEEEVGIELILAGDESHPPGRKQHVAYRQQR